MNQTDTSSTAAANGILGRARGLLDAISGRARAIADKGKQQVSDRQIAHQRRDLLLKLGELYYNAHSTGMKGPCDATRERLMADLDALDHSSDDYDDRADDSSDNGR